MALLAPLSAARADPRGHVEMERARIVRGEVVAPLVNGGSTKLLLDAELQRASERLLRMAAPVEGGLVAIDPRSGRLLAFASLAQNGNVRGLLTRARLPAASVFKLVTTTTLFETTALELDDEICIDGGVHGIERRHLEPAHGASARCGPFVYALGHSKNAVYAQLATRLLTRDDLMLVAGRLGFNGKLPFDAEEAEVGRLSVPYNDLEFARAAAGFEGSQLSPLGAAYLSTLVARGGLGVELTALPAREAAEEDGTELLPPLSPERIFSARTARLLTRMMEVTVETGTSRAAFTAPDGKRYLKGIRVAGKTGTLKPDASGAMTSWFTGFAPSRRPEIVVSVMLVNGSVYRRKANELARDFLRSYFSRQGRPDVSDPFAEAPGPEARASR